MINGNNYFLIVTFASWDDALESQWSDSALQRPLMARYIPYVIRAQNAFLGEIQSQFVSKQDKGTRKIILQKFFSGDSAINE